MSRYLLATVGCVAACFAACSNGNGNDGSNPGDEANLGQVSLSVAAAPSDVHCVVVQASNSTRSVTRNIDVTPGQAITTTVNGLPTGTVTVSALAYAATCSALTSSSVANWASDPQSQTINITAGATVPLNLVLRPSGAISPTIDWQGDGTGGTGSGGSSSLGGSTSTGGSSTGGSTAVPAGWWTSWKSEGWHGCPWAAIDSTATTLTPTDFTSIANGGPYHVSGTVAGSSTYSSYAMLGFNLGQNASGASCAYDPALLTKTGTPGVTMPTGSTGIALNIAYLKATPTIRVQLMGPNGATDANSRWCQVIPTLSSPVFLKFTDFSTSCWDSTNKGAAYSGQAISSISFIVPGGTTTIAYDFVVNGFAAGTSAADAPTGGTTTSLTGTIGGAGATDLDAQRVKVTKSGEDYIIQNNNFGNPSGSDQTLSYTDNSFRVVSSTGTGSSSPASFPSIFIGSNGTTTTKYTDNLPRQVSAISSVQTTMTWSGTCGSGFNATYDAWFASSAPTASYNDGISGFVMVWLCKPSDHQPIGSLVRTVTIAGQSWNVYSGPRGGSGANANAPVVSYVKSGTALNTFTFNLKDFITDAASNGIQSSWYLTDVFGGFQIWNGSSATNLSVSNFTCVVQ